MTATPATDPAHSGEPSAAPTDPPVDISALVPPVRLWEDGFATDPHRYYEELRSHGPVGWCELAPGVAAYLVTGHRAALDLLQNPEIWSHDPRPWETTVPGDPPVLGMMRWRPNTLFADGEAHLRYRRTLVDAFSLVEPHDLRERVRRAVEILVCRFGPKGRADLVSDFCRPLMAIVFNDLFGLPMCESERLDAALALLIEGGERAAAGERDYFRYVAELIDTKTAKRGKDLTSWLLDHPLRLTPEEVTWQVFLTLGTGHEPVANLVSNALSRILGNPDYYQTLTRGARPVMEAVTEVLRYEPPLANYAIYYSRRTFGFHGTWVRSAVPVAISFGALAYFAEKEYEGGHHPRDASHVTWGAGPHVCPVKQHTLLIAIEAIERLTQWLPDLDPVLPRERLSWRPGPFHRSLTALPVRFTPRTPEPSGERP
ncbi:cytochrome P450 [Streptomyces sp. NPDC057638]|uniref:cytochrome P450 n=1 Tax=Streptomyces sp. NPDC057638 TaxID=3346190 RepID=UPI0036AC509D